MGLHFLLFWLYGPSFPLILAFWAFISFHFGLVGLHFLHFGVVGLYFLSFWPCGASFPFTLGFWAFISFILAFWAFISFILALWWLARRVPPTSCQRRSVFSMSHIKNLAVPGPAPFSNFWPSGPSFPFILALWAFISFHFGLVGLHFLHFGLVSLHFLSFWPCGPSFPCILALSGSASGPPPTSCQKLPFFPIPQTKNLAASRPAPFSAFWAFISFHFGLLGLHFLSFWPLAFWPCGG